MLGAHGQVSNVRHYPPVLFSGDGRHEAGDHKGGVEKELEEAVPTLARSQGRSQRV